MKHMLDINDIAIRLVSLEGANASAGYVSVKGKELVFGEQARSIFSLQPSKSSNQYWRDLSTQKTAASFPSVRHQADLVWNHLGSFGGQALEDLGLVALPSHYTKDQLALLSGILNALGAKDLYLCNRSLLMASAFPHIDYHLDFQLHQLVVTQINRKGTEISAGEMTEYPGLGLLGCCDAVLKAVQARFIEKTRFDPLHHAETEQQLFNQLVDSLFGGVWSGINLSVETSDSARSIELSENHLLEAASEYLQRLEEVLPSGLFVADAIFSCLPLSQTNKDKTAGIERIRVLEPQQIFELAEALKAQLSPASEFSELRAIQLPGLFPPEPAQSPETPAADDTDISQNQTTAFNEETLALDTSPSPALQPEAISESDVAAEVSRSTGRGTTHLVVKGIALAGSNKLVCATEGRLGCLDTDRALTTSADVLGSCSSSAQGLCLASDKGLRINGSLFVDRQILEPEDLISHDDYPGTLVAIQVIGDV